MHDQEELLGKYFRKIDPPRQESPEEIELAFHLQNAGPNDPRLVEPLVDRYAGEIFCWIALVLSERKTAVPSRDVLLTILEEVFATALCRLDQFHGQENITVWLLAIAYQRINRYRLASHSTNNLSLNHAQGTAIGDPGISIPQGFDKIRHLPEKIRLPLLLRYLFDLDLQGIAVVLGLSEQEAHRRLARARSQLLAISNQSHMDYPIQSYMDGILVNQPARLRKLTRHIETCDLCQAHAAKLTSLETDLSADLKQHAAQIQLGSDERTLLVQSIKSKLEMPQVRSSIQLQVGKAAWVLGLAVMFVGMVFVLLRLNTLDELLHPSVGEPSMATPPVIQTQSSHSSRLQNTQFTSSPQYIEPAFSADGNWAVFTSLNSSQVTLGDTSPTIELFNRETGVTQVISRGSAPADKPWIWWDLAPGISADGHWIVFVNATLDPAVKGAACETPDHQPCLDIILYDRDSGTSQRLTQAFHGGPSDGDSLAPVITADGRYVAFWSSAENLVDGFSARCHQGDVAVTCLYIYILDRDTGTMDWIPYPTIPGDPVYGADPISLSADGRFVGFTAQTNMLSRTSSSVIMTVPKDMEKSPYGPAVFPQLPESNNSTEAVVYDRQTHQFELENQAQDGTMGNAASTSTLLSADGRVAAFISSASNLVAGQADNSPEIYVRDRQTGEVELISLDNTRGASRGDRGLSLWERRFYSMALSSDGRFLVFLSTDSNLAASQNSTCSPVDLGQCSFLYIYDRLRGSTEQLSAFPSREFAFFPQISSNGRWVSFMQASRYCSSAQYLCSEVILYDRLHHWMTNLTRNEQKIPDIGWSFSSSLALPWQAWESTAISFSPDGKLIAMGSADSSIRVWQLSAGSQSEINPQLVTTLQSSGRDYLQALSFSANGKFLAAGSNTGAVYVWSLSDADLLYTMSDSIGPVSDLAFLAESNDLVVSALSGVWIYSITENQESLVNDFQFSSTKLDAIAISAMGGMIATASSDRSVTLQRIPGGNVLGSLNTNQQYVRSMAFSEDGSLLALRAWDGTINIWQIDASGSEPAVITPLISVSSYVYDGNLYFSPDDQYLISTGMVGGMTLWSIPDGKIYSLSTPSPMGKVDSLAFSRDERRLAVVVEGELMFWEYKSDQSSLFYEYATQGTFVDSAPDPPSAASDILTMQPQSIFNQGSALTLEQARGLLSFHMLLPTRLPENVTFRKAYAGSDGSMLLQYDIIDPSLNSTSLFVYEKFVGDATPPMMTIGYGSDVSRLPLTTSSGSVSSEYVKGDWYLRQGYTPHNDYFTSGEFHQVWLWDNNSGSQRLRWIQNGVLIGIYVQASWHINTARTSGSNTYDTVSNSSIFDKSDLEQIAFGMSP